MTIGDRIGSGWRGARWLLLIAAVVAITLAGLAIAPSPACRPITESEAARLKEGEIPLLRWITDTMGAAVGYPLSFVRWRRGYLEDEAAFRNRLAGILQPLDIIVVKNGYKVTDAIIPGVFTHAAIWLGDEASLRRVGLWDHPDVAPLQEEIAQGMTVIEAEPGGTVLASLDRMIDSDRLAVVRVRSRDSDLAEWRCELASLAIHQLGHPYDYSFDLASPERLSCAEVLTQTFKGVTWQARLLFGRPTILPDDVVRLALAEDSAVALVAYFAGGANSGWTELHADELASELKAICSP